MFFRLLLRSSRSSPRRRQETAQIYITDPESGCVDEINLGRAVAILG